MKKRIIGIFMVLCMMSGLMSFMTIPAAAATSGTCGDNLTWELDDEGTLTISGEGDMYDYKSHTYVHWYSYRSSITNVVINSGVTTIGDYAFYYCERLSSVTIPDSVTTIGNYAFSDCTSLTSVNITSIEAWCRIAFGDAYANPLHYANNLYLNGNLVTNITIPDSVTSIKDYAFNGCTSLASVTIGSGVTSIGSYAFRYCESLTEFIVSDENMYYFSDEGGVLYNKDQSTLIQYPATKTNASYIIPDSVTSIKGYAFYNCKNLLGITIGSSVTSIGNYAFYACNSLLSATIGNNVTSIGDWAFQGCNGLASINIPDSVTIIGAYAFHNCKGLSKINIGSGVTSIGVCAFTNCINLTRVNITSIEAWCNIAFGDEYANPLGHAKKLYLNGNLVANITIPDSVTSIKDYAFKGCTSLASISIPDSVTSIGNYAFYNCTNLLSVNIPNSITSIKKYAFHNCSSLASVTIPNSVTSIARYAFYNCSNLTSINIPNSVTGIGEYAFSDCTSLSSVTIPNSVTSIGVEAFYNCTSLATVNYNGKETAWNSISISSNNSCLEDADRNYFWYVTYIDENGDVMQRDMVTIDTTVTLPDFSDIDETYGFYTDSAFTEEFDATEPITGNTVIYVPLSMPPAPPEPFTINSIAIKDLSGNELSEIPNGKFLATFSITNTSSYSDAMVVLAQYSALGKLNGLMYVSVEDMTKGATFKLTLPVDNTAGDVGKLNAFVWDSFESMKALGNPVTFPAE